MSVSDSKDVLGRPPKTHSNPRSEGLQNVQESAYDMMFLGAHESYAFNPGLANHRGLVQVPPYLQI